MSGILVKCPCLRVSPYLCFGILFLCSKLKMTGLHTFASTLTCWHTDSTSDMTRAFPLGLTIDWLCSFSGRTFLNSCIFGLLYLFYRAKLLSFCHLNSCANCLIIVQHYSSLVSEMRRFCYAIVRGKLRIFEVPEADNCAAFSCCGNCINLHRLNFYRRFPLAGFCCINCSNGRIAVI